MILGGAVFLVCILLYTSQNKTDSNFNPGYTDKEEAPSIEQPSTRIAAGMSPIVGALKGIEIHRKNQQQVVTEIEERIAEESDEQQREKNWKANFPYKPTYHPSLLYDPERYNPRNPDTFTGDPEMEMAVKNHGYLIAFYNNPQIYTAEFEQLFHMLSEIDRSDNPIITGDIFANLKSYHQCKMKDQSALWSKKEYVPSNNTPDSNGKMVPIQVPIDGNTTWGDRAKSYHDAIVGLLVRSKYWPNKDLLDADVARGFRDRLIKEISPDNLSKMQPIVHLPNGEIGAFGYYYDAMLELKPGDKLLIR